VFIKWKLMRCSSSAAGLNAGPEGVPMGVIAEGSRMWVIGAGLRRVGMWRGGCRLTIAVSAPFDWGALRRPYSEDLRIRIVAAVEAGASCSAAARQFGVSPSCAIKLLQRWRRTGSVLPAPRGKKPYALEHDEVLVRDTL